MICCYGSSLSSDQQFLSGLVVRDALPPGKRALMPVTGLPSESVRNVSAPRCAGDRSLRF
jgi:hypothetical protein